MSLMVKCDYCDENIFKLLFLLPIFVAAEGCEKPPHLSNGDPKESSRLQYSHSERVEYICQDHYRMEGGPYKTCVNGQWTGEMRCLSKM